LTNALTPTNRRFLLRLFNLKPGSPDEKTLDDLSAPTTAPFYHTTSLFAPLRQPITPKANTLAGGRGTAPLLGAQPPPLSPFFVCAESLPLRRRGAFSRPLLLVLRHTPAEAVAARFSPPQADAGVCPARALIGDVSFGLTWIWGAAQVFGYLSNRLKLLKSRAKRQNYILC